MFSIHSQWRFLCMSIKNYWPLLIASIFLKVLYYSQRYNIFVSCIILGLYKIHRYLEIASPLEEIHWWTCLNDEYLKDYPGKSTRILLLIAKTMNGFSETIKRPWFIIIFNTKTVEKVYLLSLKQIISLVECLSISKYYYFIHKCFLYILHKPTVNFMFCMAFIFIYGKQ